MSILVGNDTKLAVAGITAYRSAFGRRKAVPGLQPEPFEGAQLWVVPNPSGLNAHYQLPRLIEVFEELRRHIGAVA